MKKEINYRSSCGCIATTKINVHIFIMQEILRYFYETSLSSTMHNFASFFPRVAEIRVKNSAVITILSLRGKKITGSIRVDEV